MNIVIINLSDEESARDILKAELSRRGISYVKLAEMMATKGWKLTKGSMDNKMFRGKFSADFFLDALKVIGCNGVGIAQRKDSRS